MTTRELTRIKSDGAQRPKTCRNSAHRCCMRKIQEEDTTFSGKYERPGRDTEKKERNCHQSEGCQKEWDAMKSRDLDQSLPNLSPLKSQ